MHRKPDYAAAVVVLHTDSGVSGHGLTFTNGRGTEVCVAAVRALEPLVAGRTLDGITGDMRGFWRSLVSDDQLRWLGPEKGVIHLAVGAVVNAVWDLWAKKAGVPLWKLLTRRRLLHPRRRSTSYARPRRASRNARQRSSPMATPHTPRRQAGSGTRTRR